MPKMIPDAAREASRNVRELVGADLDGGAPEELRCETLDLLDAAAAIASAGYLEETATARLAKSAHALIAITKQED